MALPPFERPIDAEGVWCQLLPGARRGGAALFLDRDGVVVEDREYLAKVEDIVFVPHAAAVIAEANTRHIPVVLVTNQSGIGRGYYGWGEFAAVQDGILAGLAAQGARIDAVYATPHHPDASPPFAHADHPARKPNPGMLTRAGRDLALDLGRSWLVGDKAIDVEAARRAGLAGAIHVLTGHGAKERAAAVALARPGFTVKLGQSTGDARALLPLLAASA